MSVEVLVLGGEPAALSCAARLLHEGARVAHVYPQPWGLAGASRDIGVAYPELGEPLERLEYSLGAELAAELHAWGREGIDLLSAHCRDWEGLRRGSRLSVCRSEVEAKLSGSDALDRQRLGDEVRLMSGGAASNYAPLSTFVHQASFETHTLAFAPAPLCEHLAAGLAINAGYHAYPLAAATWASCGVGRDGGEVRACWDGGEVRAEVAVIAAAHESGRLLGKFGNVLVPLLGQAFRSEPLRECSRSSVLAITASWGHERYRFDEERRLLGCGIAPSSGDRHEQPVVLDHAQEALWRRAVTIFSDLSRSGPDILRWGALFTTTCDGLPLLGPLPGEPRILVAAGFSTSAWSRGYQAGHYLASCLARGGASSGLMSRCSPRRLT